MRILSLAIATCVAGLLSACGPTFNWRDVTIGATPLMALFPCKPDDTQRTVPLAGDAQLLTMRSCVAGGATFAIGHARLSDPTQSPRALAQWRDTTLGGLGPVPVAVSLQVPVGSPALPQLLGLSATRDPSRGSVQSLRGLWFARGPDIFAAFVLAPARVTEAAEPFFSGLRLR
ncbi:MAG: hypothetical protein ABJA49_16995 [Betaproteobacteria bacterium]